MAASHFFKVLSLLAVVFCLVTPVRSLAQSSYPTCLNEYKEDFSKTAREESSANRPQTSDTSEIVDQIEAAMGLGDNIKVYASTDPTDTACATYVRTNIRVVYYNSAWLENYSKGSYWIKVGVIAHEIGHHQNFHASNDGKNPWKKEIEADVYLGSVVRSMHGKLDDAIRTMANVSSIGDELHPPRYLREAAVIHGFQGQVSAISAKSTSDQSVDPVWYSPNTYCDGLDNMLGKTVKQFSYVGNRGPQGIFGQKQTEASQYNVNEKIFNEAHSAPIQCVIAKYVDTQAYYGYCESTRANLSDFQAAYATAIQDLKYCLGNRGWSFSPNSSKSDVDTALPDQVNYRRSAFYGVNQSKSPPQELSLFRTGTDSGKHFSLGLRWSIKEDSCGTAAWC